MPLYEFQCEECGERFEEFAAVGGSAPACTLCGAKDTRRVYTAPAPARQFGLWGRAARESDSRRSEREAARQERLADIKKKRARGELPERRRTKPPPGLGP